MPIISDGHRTDFGSCASERWSRSTEQVASLDLSLQGPKAPEILAHGFRTNSRTHRDRQARQRALTFPQEFRRAAQDGVAIISWISIDFGHEGYNRGH